MAGLAAAAVAGGSALAGGFSAADKAKRDRRALQEYINQQKLLQNEIKGEGGIEQTRTGEVNKTYDPITGTFTTNATDYFNALKSADYSRYDVKTPDKFEFDMEAATQAELNPDIEAIINRSTGAVQQAAANRSGLFSGSAAKGIARSTADIQAAEWDKARQRAQQQRQNKYQVYIDEFNNALRATGFNRDNLTAGLNAQGTLFQSQGNLFNTQQNQLQDIRNAADTAYMQSRGAEAGATAQRAGISNNYWGNFAQGALGGLAGGSQGAVEAYKL